MKNILLSLLFAISIVLQGTSQNNQNTSLIGMWTYGPGNSVGSWDNYAMLSLGRTIQIYDYAAPQQPQLTGELFLGDMIFAFAFDNDLAFAGGYKGLHIVDIADVTNPVLLSFLPIENYVKDVALHNGYAYITLYESGIGVVDYSDPSNPVIVNSVETDLHSSEMVIAGEILWVASGYDGFAAWDISNPIVPEQLLNNDEHGNITGIEVFGQYLYVLSGSEGLLIFDTSNLPELNLTTIYPGYYFNGKLHRDGQLLAFTNLYYGFTLYDLANPTLPDSLSTYSSASPNRKVILNNGNAL